MTWFLLPERIAATIGGLVVFPEMLELVSVDPYVRGVAGCRALVASAERDSAALASVDVSLARMQLRSFLRHAPVPVQRRC